jgi:hypothetical protein
LRWAALIGLLISPAFADEPDGPDDSRLQQQVPPPPQVETQPPVYQPPPPVYQAPQPVYPPPQPMPQPIVQQPSSEEIAHLESSGKSMKAGGAVMIALGAALEITSLAMTLYSQFAAAPVCTVSLSNGTVCPDDPRIPFLIAGTVGELVGGGLIGGGLAVLSAGNGRIRRARLLKLHMGFGPQQVSAQVGMTF